MSLHRCNECGLPVSLSKQRRELLERVAAGRWFDGPDSDLDRLDSLAKDALVFWRDPGFTGDVRRDGYLITERGHELLDRDIEVARSAGRAET